MSLSREEVLFRHFPHRLQLLLTFKERFCDESSISFIATEQRRKYQDFYRCSKDISMMMIRFFCEEMGLSVKEGDGELTERKHNSSSRYRGRKVRLEEIKNHPDLRDLTDVLIAANRAIAHLEESDVDHDIDEVIMTSAINFTVALLRECVFDTEEEFDRALSLRAS